jgi:hypothetical protein
MVAKDRIRACYQHALLIVARTSKGIRAQSAVMESWLSTARMATTES